jgi:undecaprenyl diphosphate synthase
MVSLPKHIAIVMDGNGRWAEARGEPRTAGHRAGIEPVRRAIRECARLGVQALTLFAFSSENWRRPETEVATLMSLFMEALDREVEELHANGVRLRIIGNRQRLSVRLQQRIAEAEALTAANTGLRLQVAVSYGGRWDLVEAARRLAARAASGALQPSASTRRRWRRSCSWPTCRIPTSSSAREATIVSAISCCGTSPTPSSSSPTRCGPISMRARSPWRSRISPTGSGATA